MADVKEYIDPKTGERYPIGGCIITDNSSDLPLFAASPFAHKHMPPSVNLRKHMTPVEHQGRSNSCSAHAVAGAYEFLIKKNIAKDIDVSRLFIYYNGRVKDGQNPSAMHDSGSTIRGVIKGMEQYGCCTEKIWKYILKSINRKPSGESYKRANKYRVTNIMHIPSHLNTMKSCLADGYPFIFGLKLFNSFFKPAVLRKGRVPIPSRHESQSAAHGWHAMVAVGYSDRSQCFFVRNSWGTKWGDHGYCYIPYKYMSNRHYCKDLHVIKAASVKPRRRQKFRVPNHVQSGYKVHEPTTNQESSDSDSDSNDASDGTEFLRPQDMHHNNLAYEPTTDPDDSCNGTEYWGLDDTYNYYVEYESATDPDIFVLKEKCEEVKSQFTSCILWIDAKSDVTEIVETKLTITDKIKIDFRPTFTQGIDYLVQNSPKIESSMYQIVCRGYYRDEKKNPLDLLDLLIDIGLDYLPILIITKDKAKIESHMNTQAPTMDLHNWKERVFITDDIDELYKKLKDNIANKKGSNTEISDHG